MLLSQNNGYSEQGDNGYIGAKWEVLRCWIIFVPLFLDVKRYVSFEKVIELYTYCILLQRSWKTYKM